MNANCARARTLMLQAVDDELLGEESAWLGAHVQSCSTCRVMQLRFHQIDANLRHDGALLSEENPSPPGVRSSLLAKMAATQRGGSKNLTWLIPAAAAAFAALLLIGIVAIRTRPPGTQTRTSSPQTAANEASSQPALPSDVPVAQGLPSPDRRTPRLRTSTTPARNDREVFIPIPFTAPLAPYERTTIARMEVAVSALIAAGVDVRSTDPVVEADVLVGQDGRAHAVRVLSKSN
jgi:anti-sigma factor RsiW